MRIEDARQAAFRAELLGAVSGAMDERKQEIMNGRANSLGRLNDVLFDELERLNELDVTDEEATKREIKRSQAIEGTARSIVENGKTILAATRMRAEFGVGVEFPKMLGE